MQLHNLKISPIEYTTCYSKAADMWSVYETKLKTSSWSVVAAKLAKGFYLNRIVTLNASLNFCFALKLPIIYYFLNYS